MSIADLDRLKDPTVLKDWRRLESYLIDIACSRTPRGRDLDALPDPMPLLVLTAVKSLEDFGRTHGLDAGETLRMLAREWLKQNMRRDQLAWIVEADIKARSGFRDQIAGLRTQLAEARSEIARLTNGAGR